MYKVGNLGHTAMLKSNCSIIHAPAKAMPEQWLAFYKDTSQLARFELTTGLNDVQQLLIV